MGYAEASSTLQPSHTLCPAQPGQAEGLGSFAMGDAEAAPSAILFVSSIPKLTERQWEKHADTKYTRFSCCTMAGSDHKWGQIALQIIFQGKM